MVGKWSDLRFGPSFATNVHLCRKLDAMIASPVMFICANSGTFSIALPLIYLILTATGSVSIISDSRETMSAFAGCLPVCVHTP